MTIGRTPPDVPGEPGEGTIVPGSHAEKGSADLMDGRYRIERVLGEGAFGRVYLASDMRIGRTVAIKELLASRNETDAESYARYLERFQREARAAGVVQHPNIVAILQLAIDRGENYYLVMEYIEGTDLRRLLSQVHTLPIDRAVQITLDIARALDAVHEQDVVHRDLKPANIMLTRRGVAKLADFGVAQVGHESHRTQISTGHPGTPLYMSPEQGSGYGYIDGRSDLYSLGLVLYEMLTGEPYPRRRQPLEVLRPDTPPELVAIFRRMTEKDPDARYEHAGDVVLALSQLSSGPPIRTATESGAPDLPDRTVPAVGERSTSAAASWPTTPPIDPRSGSGSGAHSQPASAISIAGNARAAAGSTNQVAPTKKRVPVLPIGIGAAIVATAAVVAFVMFANGRTSGTPVTPTSGPIPTVTAAGGKSLATPEPTATVARAATPEAPTRPPTPSPAPTAAAQADFSQWVTTEVAGRYRRSYDPATGEYHVTLVAENAVQPLLSPDTLSVADFTLDVDVRHVSGPEAGGYGLAFRVQPLGPGDSSHAAYLFVIDGLQRYALYQLSGDGTTIFVQPFTALPTGAMNAGPTAINHLTVTCRGDIITLAVNGNALNSYTAGIPQPGTVGIAVEAPPKVASVETAFRNLRVTPL